MEPEDRFTKARAAYAVLKKSIDERFPTGRFVAFVGGRVVADADSVEGLCIPLIPLGLTLQDVAIDQAGVEQKIEYLGWITTEALLGHWIECVLSPES